MESSFGLWETILYAAPWVEAVVYSGAWVPALGLPAAAWLMEVWANKGEAK